MKKKLVVGITGASGTVYGYTLVRVLHELGYEVHVIMTRTGLEVLKFECALGRDEIARYATLYANDDFFAAVSSGSFLHEGMVIVPCSMRAIGAIASGAGGDLLARAADVVLKERRKLVVVPRETPLNEIHLENMLKLTRAGAVVLPASPAFYHHPLGIEDMISFVTGKILDTLGINNEVFKRWQ